MDVVGGDVCVSMWEGDHNGSVGVDPGGAVLGLSDWGLVWGEQDRRNGMRGERYKGGCAPRL